MSSLSGKHFHLEFYLEIGARQLFGLLYMQLQKQCKKPTEELFGKKLKITARQATTAPPKYSIWSNHYFESFVVIINTTTCDKFHVLSRKCPRSGFRMSFTKWKWNEMKRNWIFPHQRRTRWPSWFNGLEETIEGLLHLLIPFLRPSPSLLSPTLLIFDKE